eukprot:g25438.t1
MFNFKQKLLESSRSRSYSFPVYQLQLEAGLPLPIADVAYCKEQKQAVPQAVGESKLCLLQTEENANQQEAARTTLLPQTVNMANWAPPAGHQKEENH